MKNKVMALFCAASLLAPLTANADVQYKVTVKDKALEGDTIRMVIPSVSRTEAKSVVTKGQCVFEGSAPKEYTTAYLFSTDKKQAFRTFMVLLDGTPVEVSAQKMLKASSTNKTIDNVQQQVMDLNKEYSQLMRDAKKNGTDVDAAKVEALESKMTSVQREAMDKNKGTMAALFFAGAIKYELSADEIEKVLNQCEQYKENDTYKQLSSMLNGLKKRAIGNTYTDFAGADTTGVQHRLSDYIGKGYLLVDFWASWCGPCRAEMPNVKKAYEMFHSKGFDVLGMSLDNNAAAWKNSIKSLGLPWNHLSNLKGWQDEAVKLYGINGIPCMMLFGPDGKIVGTDLRGQALIDKLTELCK